MPETRVSLRVGALVALLLALALSSSTAEASARVASKSQLVVYSLATAEQFVNNADDRARGIGNNPFGNFKDKVAVVEEKGNGPFAGDEVVFLFGLYRDRSASHLVGQATLTCNYYFSKNAFCQGVYTLGASVIFANGAFNFNASRFTLTLAGGSGRYDDANGVLDTSPVTNHMQRIVFQMETG
jgi:hypothetical protein